MLPSVRGFHATRQWCSSNFETEELIKIGKSVKVSEPGSWLFDHMMGISTKESSKCLFREASSGRKKRNAGRERCVRVRKQSAKQCTTRTEGEGKLQSCQTLKRMKNTTDVLCFHHAKTCFSSLTRRGIISDEALPARASPRCE